MKINAEQKEILYEVFELGRKFEKRYGHSENIEDWMKENEDKILALGKPRPLAKNKQTQEHCLNCGEPIDEQYDIPTCSLSCYCIMKYD